MDKLLSLILSIFSDSESLAALIAKLLEAALRNVDDPDGCKDRLLNWVRNKTLDDKFREDPIGVIICIAHVVVELAESLHDDDDDGGEEESSGHPMIFGEDPYVSQMAEAMELPIPAGGPIVDTIVQMIITKLLEWLKDQIG